jgi:hypothetical protein
VESHPEISEFGTSVSANEKVLGLHVSMYDSGVVRGL